MQKLLIRLTAFQHLFCESHDSFLLTRDRGSAGLNDSDSHRLTHITDSETTERRKIGEGFDAQGLGRFQVDNASISGLDEFGVLFQNLTRAAVHLLLDESEFASDVRGVAIQHWRVSVSDLTGVVHNNNLSFESSHRDSWLVLGIGSDESTSKILDGHVLHVETDVVSRHGLGKRFVVHFHRFDFRNKTCGRELSMNTRFDNTRFDTADGNSSDTTNLVYVLKGKSERLLGWTLGRLDTVKSLEQVGALVPWHVSRFFNHVVSFPSRNGDERDLHRLVSDLFEVGKHFILDFVVTGLSVLDGLVIHFVAGNNHLLDTESVGKKSVLASLSVLGDTGLEPTLRRINDKNGDIGLRSSSNHVLDEITVSGGIDDSELVLGRLELPQGNVDGDTTFTFSLQVVQDPGVLEGAFTKFSGFLLELLNGTLIDTTAFVNQVTSSGGLSCLDLKGTIAFSQIRSAQRSRVAGSPQKMHPSKLAKNYSWEPANVGESMTPFATIHPMTTFVLFLSFLKFINHDKLTGIDVSDNDQRDVDLFFTHG